MTEKHLVLDDTQKQALEALKDKLGSFAGGLEHDEYSRKRSATQLFYQQPELSNVFGILGGRGAGKSTILKRLYRDWSRTRDHMERTGSPCDLYLTPPLDCSVLPSDLSPGAAVLLWLKKVLTARVQQAHPPREPGAPNGEPQKLINDLGALVGSYTRTGRAYQELCLELSSSPGDYGHYVTEGLNERFDLSEHLRSWLEEARHELLDSCQAVVILLDDFDLVPAAEVRRWQRSLLDELHQYRLLFVLSADYYRLEHLGWDAEERFDDKTGRALVDKMLPVQNRVELPEWSLEARKEFIPRRSQSEPPVSEGVSDRHAEKRDEPKTLWKLVQSAIEDWPDLKRPIATLLPHRPRGLVNLYEILAASYGEEKKGGEKKDGQPQVPNITEFLSMLAICRAEPLLARRIKESKLTEWASSLKFPDQRLAVEEWGAMVHAARQMEDGDNLLPPLVSLTPVTTWHDLGSTLDTSDEPKAAHTHTTASIQVVGSLGGTASQDPLRHEWQHLQPLRDANAADQPLWAELLLDLGFHAAGDKTPHGPCRRRRLFLDTWRPAVFRLESARFNVRFERAALEAFFADNADLISKATLCWLYRPSPQDLQVMVGWVPLMDGLRGARDPLSTELLGDLLVDPSSIADDSRAKEEPKVWPLLPGKLRALLLLIDGLHRCPWMAFSAPLNWQVATYLGLAAAYVRTSYVYALCQSGRLKDEKLSSEQKLLLDGLRARDPLHLLRRQEEDVTERLIALFDDRLGEALTDSDCVLSVATNAYLDSPVYTSVVNLLKSRRQV